MYGPDRQIAWSLEILPLQFQVHIKTQGCQPRAIFSRPFHIPVTAATDFAWPTSIVHVDSRVLPLARDCLHCLHYLPRRQKCEWFYGSRTFQIPSVSSPHSECKGIKYYSEDSSEYTFLLVENYNYLTAPSWSCIEMGIFELPHYLFIIIGASSEGIEKRKISRHRACRRARD